MDSFIERLASPTPVPGGGAASASVAVIAASLNSMVSGITEGKKSYSRFREQMALIKQRSGENISELRKLMEDDERAFNLIVDTWKLPKENEDQQKRRNDALIEASKEAIAVPWKIAAISFQILRDALYLARHGLKSAITDSQCSAEFAIAAIRGVLQNVAINLQNMGKDFRESEEIKMKLFLDDAQSTYAEVTDTVRKYMTGVN